MAGYFIFFLVTCTWSTKIQNSLTCSLFTAVPSTHSFLCSLCKEKKTQTRGEHTIQSTKLKKFSLDMLAMCSDGSTPILQIQCDPLGNGCERILHTATEKTKTNFTG